MTSMKKLILFVLFLPILSFAQGTFSYRAQPLLEYGEVQHYLKTYKSIVLEINGLKIENESISLVGFLQEQSKNRDVLQIFQKHGWSPNYLRKWTVIDLAFREIESVKAVEYNKSQNQAVYQSIDPNALYGRLVHIEDSKRVQPFYTQLQQLSADAEDW